MSCAVLINSIFNFNPLKKAYLLERDIKFTDCSNSFITYCGVLYVKWHNLRYWIIDTRLILIYSKYNVISNRLCKHKSEETTWTEASFYSGWHDEKMRGIFDLTGQFYVTRSYRRDSFVYRRRWTELISPTTRCCFSIHGRSVRAVIFHWLVTI